MAKTRPLGPLAATLMLACSLSACDGAVPQEGASVDVTSTTAAPASTTETVAKLQVASAGSASEGELAAKLGVATSYASLDELASAMGEGSVDVAFVGDAEASRLYHELGGACMAICALDSGGDQLLVLVVSMQSFSQTPEEVVAYIGSVEGQAQKDGVAFFSGVAMQNAVAARLKDRYLQDPASVGDTVPPDNFYFLG